jgi:hypothetical protein
VATASPESSRVALVIGNAGYRFGPPLANPHNDSEAIARTLDRLGFAPVILRKDLGRIELGRELSDFQMRAENSEMAIIYFAGHGLEIDGQNYLVPVDAELQHVGRTRFEAIPLSDVLPVVHGAKILQLVILDACRDNPFVGHMRGLEGTRSFGLGLSNIEPGGNTLVAYAAKHGTKAKDGPLGSNSPYAEALLQHFETPDLEIRYLFGRVRDAVLQKTHKAQEPHLYGSLGGEEIYLKRSRPLRDAAGKQTDHGEAEARWLEFDLDHSEDVELIEAWLAQYGDRAPLLARIARKRLEEIAERRRQQDATEWAAAQDVDSLAAYEGYLAAWPAGVGAAAANARRTAMQDDAAWDRAVAANTIEAFGEYLEAWAEGRHRGEATTKSLALAAEQEQVKGDQDKFDKPQPPPKPVPPKPAPSPSIKQSASWGGGGLYWAGAIIFWIATGHFNFLWPLEGVGLALKAAGIEAPYPFTSFEASQPKIDSSYRLQDFYKPLSK